MPVTCSLPLLYNMLREKLAGLNVFDSRSNDPAVVRRQILATRLFLVLLAASIVILAGYAFVSEQIKSETVVSPAQSVYQALYQKYPDSLQCPCSKISIPYGKFVRLVPSFHQVCSSDFVAQAWLDFTFAINATTIWPIDIRRSLSAIWQSIGALCRTAINATLDALDQFTNAPLIGSMMLSEALLETKAQATLDLQRRAASGAVGRPLTMMHRIVQVNELITGLATNYIAVTNLFSTPLLHLGDPDDSEYVGMFSNRYVLPGNTTTCTCKNNGSCPLPANLYLHKAIEKYGIYDLNRIQANGTLPGLVIDCFPLKMLLRSTLECFYNRTCLDVLFTGYRKAMNVSLLDPSKQTRFSLTADIQFLINELFIEQIDLETMFNQYYHECAPIHCHYVYPRRFDFVYVVTILLALVGGLSAGFRLAAPHLITLIFLLKGRSTRSAVVVVDTTVWTRLSNLLFAIRKTLQEMNVFSGHLHDPIRIHRDRLATRLYIVLLTASLAVLLVYSAASMQTISVTVTTPSQEEYEQLYTRFNQTLQCPCTVVSMPYEEFVQLTPTYHQVCSSEFVQSSWYSSIIPVNATDLETAFVYSASSYFRAMAALCEVANLTIIDAYREFSATAFLNAHVLPYHSFAPQTDTIIGTFIQLTRANFAHTFSSISSVLHVDQYVSNLMSSTVLVKNYIPEWKRSEFGPIRISSYSRAAVIRQNDICYCVLDAKCNLNDSSVANGEIFFAYSNLPGLYQSCSLTNSLLLSSLVCWYNATCIGKLREQLEEIGVHTTVQIQALNSKRSSRFPTDVRMQSIFDEIMIEQWNPTVSYSKFYRTCQPAQCFYTYEGRNNLIYIITVLIGLFGGLNVVLRLVSPLIVGLTTYCLETVHRSNDAFQVERDANENHPVFYRLRGKLLRLNFFDSESAERQIVQREQSSTRLYILLLLICIGILVVYLCLQQTTVSVFHYHLTQSEYEALTLNHTRSLECPCTQIATPYEAFSTIDRRFHQVCSSDFVGAIWPQLLFGDQYLSTKDRSDFRVRGMAHFVFLTSLCTLSKTTVDNAAEEFLAGRFLTSHLLSEIEFQLQINSAFEQFKATTIEKFSRTLKLIHEVTHANALVSTYSLNWFWQLPYNSTLATIPTEAVRFPDGCSCGTRGDCLQPAAFYVDYTTTVEFTIPGVQVGCSPTVSAQQSTLECFYNQTCVDAVLYYSVIALIDPEELRALVNITAMNPTVESRFQPHTLVEELVDELFLERLKIETSYASFYNHCAAAYCAYTIEQRHAWVDTISRILGLYGGLTVSLRFIVPYVVGLAFKIKTYYSKNTVSTLCT